MVYRKKVKCHLLCVINPNSKLKWIYLVKGCKVLNIGLLMPSNDVISGHVSCQFPHQIFRWKFPKIQLQLALVFSREILENCSCVLGMVNPILVLKELMDLVEIVPEQKLKVWWGWFVFSPEKQINFFCCWLVEWSKPTEPFFVITLNRQQRLLLVKLVKCPKN